MSANNQPVSQAITDSSFWKKTNVYRNYIQKKMSEIICYSDTTWIKKLPESNLGNWCADAVLWEAQQYDDTTTKIEINACILNYGGLRSSLPKGIISLNGFYELMPFENSISLIQITGTNLLLFAQYLKAEGGGVYANMVAKNQQGSLVLYINSELIKPNAIYWIATNDYLANGGDNMFFLT